MTKLVPIAMAVSALAATATGLASPAFSQGMPQVECYQSWVPAIQNCHTVSNNLGYGAWAYVSRGRRFAPAHAQDYASGGRRFAPAHAQDYASGGRRFAPAQYGPPQSPGIGPNGDARYGLYNEAPGGS
jgi:hypothetical protein